MMQPTRLGTFSEGLEAGLTSYKTLFTSPNSWWGGVQTAFKAQMDTGTKSGLAVGLGLPVLAILLLLKRGK